MPDPDPEPYVAAVGAIAATYSYVVGGGPAPRLRRLLSQAFLLFQFHHSELMPQLCRGRPGVYAANAFSGPTSPLCFSIFFSNRAQLCFVFNRDFNDDFLPRTHHDDFGFLADLSL